MFFTLRNKWKVLWGIKKDYSMKKTKETFGNFIFLCGKFPWILKVLHGTIIVAVKLKNVCKNKNQHRSSPSHLCAIFQAIWSSAGETGQQQIRHSLKTYLRYKFLSQFHLQLRFPAGVFLVMSPVWGKTHKEFRHLSSWSLNTFQTCQRCFGNNWAEWSPVVSNLKITKNATWQLFEAALHVEKTSTSHSSL